MLPRLIFIFAFVSLLVLALKKGLHQENVQIQPVPGYPSPVALKTVESISDEEFLKNISALEYAKAFSPEKTNAEVMGPEPHKAVTPVLVAKKAKRSVATKIKFKKVLKPNRKVKL